jgi:drug/metabolite transporter (DMT)-like permease
MSDSSETRTSQDSAWLSRPKTIRLLWWLFALILVATLVAQFAVDMHPHFGADGWFGFNAIYGFLTCVAMVLLAKALGWVLKRPDSYYDAEPESRESTDDV